MGNLPFGNRTSITEFATVTFDDTPQVALPADTDCIYFILNNKTSKQVNVTVGGSGAEYILDDNDTLMLTGDPSKYSVYNATDAASVSIVFVKYSYV